MAVTMADITKLRKMTGAGMMDCKNALTEAEGDFDKAMEIIRKKGQAVAAKRSEREAAEGCVLAKTTGDRAVIIALKCETDFVAQNADYVKLTQDILDLAVANKCKTLEEVKALPMGNGTVQDAVVDRSGITGEKMELDGYMTVEGVCTAVYNHMNRNGLCTIVAFNKEVNDQLAKQVAMQIAAMNPIAIDEDGVSEEVKQKEKLAEATRKLRQEEKQSSQDSVNSALKDQVSAWKQIQSIREKIAKVDNPDVINQLQETKRYYQQQYLDATKILKSNQDLYDAQGQLNRLKQIELETTAKISQYQSKNTESVSKYNQSLKDNATQKLSNYNNTSKYTPEFIERVNSKISEIGQLDITKPEDVARLKTIDSEVQKIVDDSKLLENKLVKQDSKIADIISQMKIFRSQNTNMSSSQKQALDDVINYAEKLANTGKVTAQQIEKIKISFSGLKAVVASSGNMGKNFFSQIGNRLTDMNSKFVAQFLSWQDWIRYIQQGVNTIRELDTAMTEVKKVSDATETQYSSFRDTISSTAKEIATTNKELLNSSADFLRLGYSLDQASDLAKNATLFVNVGDGVDITEATEDMITAMKAFDIQAEDSIKIVDDYNQIGNQFALSASDIGEAMKRSASALETGNNSFEQSIGLITAMNEIVQNSENTGNSLKVLSLRLRGAKAELEDMQEDTDGLCDSTSKLREQIKSLTGVDIMLDDNTFKSTTDIIKELGAVWDKLSDSSQAATLELIAGKSRANNVAALLKNYQRIDEVMESLGDAEGSAMRENEAIVDSIDGRIKKLSASMEDFWQKAINTDFVKNIVSSLDTILNLLTKIIDQFGLLPTIIGVGGAGTGIFKFIKNFDWVFKPYIKLSNSFFSWSIIDKRIT